MSQANQPLKSTPRRVSVSRAATWWAWGSVALVIAGGIFFRFADDGALGIDLWWHDLTTVTPGSAAYAVAAFMAEAGGGIGATACAAIACALLLALRRPRDAAAVVTALLLGIMASEIIKPLVFRARPWDQLYASHGASFPSGHSMGAAALAVSLALVATQSDGLIRASSQWVWVVAGVWIGLMMWSRVALHVHWLSDTIAGALLGAATAIIARRFWITRSEPVTRLPAQPTR